MVVKKMKCVGVSCAWIHTVISELALFGFLYYTQLYFGATGDLIKNTIVLWVLLNLAVVLCPLFRKCCEYKKK